MKLSRISLAILPLLSLCSVQAAVYNVVEIGEVSEVKSTYASAINDAGDTVFNGAIKLQTQDIVGNSVVNYQYFNFPIDLDAIDFDNEDVQALFTDEQLASLLNGNVDNDTLGILLNANPASQPIGNALGYLANDGMAGNNVVLRDINPPGRTNSEYLYDINNTGVAVGVASAPFSLESFTPAATEAEPEPVARNVWVPETAYQLGMIVQDGLTSIIPAPYQELGGGYTVALGISDTGLIAGYGSTGMTDTSKEAVETACTGDAAPLALCFNIKAIAGSYQQRAMTWQLQADGSVAEPHIFGFLGDKNSGEAFIGEGVDNITYFSVANDVNDKGIAVGRSIYSDSERTERVRVSNVQIVDQIVRAQQASIYVEDQVLPIVDPLEWLNSDALAVNNNDIIVGYAQKVINSIVRSRMFYHDISTNQTRFVNGFFSSSTTIPKAINDNNKIVGQAEVIIGGTTTRRSHGFVYDITMDSFVDLNSLLSCNSPYTIVDATDINENGDIVATAVVKKERRNLVGEVVVDAQGNPELEDLAVAVKLEAIANGEAENCVTGETEYQRQAGNTGFGMLLLAGVALWWRRRKA